MTTQALLAALIDPRPERQPRSRPARVARAIAVVVVWLAVMYAAGILTMWLAWNTQSWWTFWIVMGFMLLALPLVFLALFNLDRSRFFTLSRSQLRDVLIHADEQLASPISIQPVPTSPGSEEEHLGPFVCSPMQGGSTKRRISIVAGVALFLPYAVMMLSVPLIFVLPSQSIIIPILLLGGAGLLLIDMVALIIWAIRSSLKRLAVTANSSGVTWHLGARGQVQHMDWSQARALLRINAASSSSSSSILTNYVLIGTDTVMIWSLPATPRAPILRDSERLLGIISVQTRLPLRDATKFASTLSGAGKSTQRLLEYYDLAAHMGTDHLHALPSQTPSPVSAGWVVGIVVSVLLASLPLAAGWWAQSYSSSYFGSLEQRLIAETPLYSNTFVYADGDWPNIATGGHFTSSVYEIHNSANTTQQTALLSEHTFGDAAYSVTATESGAVPNNAEDGIGLAFHVSSDAREYVSFTVKYDGEWELMHYSPALSDGEEYLAGAFSNAIHEGPGATNTLTIVTYAQSALIFINGRFIEQYMPESFDHVDLTRTGSVGVYLNSAAMTGDFSDFVVAPVPPVDFWKVMQTMPPWQA